LEKRSWPNHKLSPSARARIAVEARKRWQKYRAALAPADGPPRVPQPPRSPLCDKLVENLGRQFQADEASFVRQLQTSFANARKKRKKI